MRVAVIGAGLAGLVCGQVLAGEGCEVQVYDKSRGVGGRMATRRVATPLGEATFDHGAQYFTVRDPEFAALVETWRAEGVAAAWPAAGPDAYVGAPAMTSPAKRLARGLETIFEFEAVSVRRKGGVWRIEARDGREAAAEALVIALPAEQASALLEGAGHPFRASARKSATDPCWTVMAAFAAPLAAPDCLRREGALSWAARNSAKPGRSGPEAFVLQAGPDWSRSHLEHGAAGVAEELLVAFSAIVGPLPDVLVQLAHRWRYARSGKDGPGRLFDAEAHLAVCGDWLLGPRVEAAYLSGRQAAQDILTKI